MLTYIYAGKVYCEACGRAIREKLKCAGNSPIFPDNPWSYSSADYPKGPYYNDGSGTSRCARGSLCLGTARFPEGQRIGAIVGDVPSLHVKGTDDPWTDLPVDEGGRDW